MGKQNLREIQQLKNMSGLLLKLKRLRYLKQEEDINNSERHIKVGKKTTLFEKVSPKGIFYQLSGLGHGQHKQQYYGTQCKD